MQQPMKSVLMKNISISEYLKWVNLEVIDQKGLLRINVGLNETPHWLKVQISKEGLVVFILMLKKREDLFGGNKAAMQ